MRLSWSPGHHQIKSCLSLLSAHTCPLLPCKMKEVNSRSMMIRRYSLMTNSPLKSQWTERMSYKDTYPMRRDHCHRITNNSTLWRTMRTLSYVRISLNQTAIFQRTSGTLIPTKEEEGLFLWTHRLLINLIPTDPQLLIQGLHQNKIQQRIHLRALLLKTT